jgi:UDP:flavonoid glycosyltransferase YjiC (YdhE family)
VVTGYWFLDRATEWTPPAELAAFLQAGPPPVCIGFGSMTFERQELLEIVSEALALSGQRGVLLAGWGGLRPPELPPNLIALEWAPLAWLFPRMAAVVHHGGAGTTAEALRAAVPAVVVPFFYDQFLWADRVHALGAGPAPIPRAELTGPRLADAIRVAVTNPGMARRAKTMSEAIRSENGVARAVEAFDEYFDCVRCDTVAGARDAVLARAAR